MANSTLAVYTRISPNKTSPRTNKILKITPHHMAGNLTLEQFGAIVANSARQMSSNYAIESSGRVGLFCEEKDRSWCSSSATNDHQAITIEVANDTGAPNWHVSDKALEALINLCVDISLRADGIVELDFTGNAKGNLTQHNYFAATACPGPYLKSKFYYIASEVNKRLASAQEEIIMPMSTKAVRMWLGPMSGGDKTKFVNMLKEKAIAYTEAAGVLTTTPAVSPGDQTGLMKLAIDTGNIGYGPVTTETNGVPQSEYDAVVAKYTTATASLNAANSKISNGLTAAKKTVETLG
jgi:hypothetical protein